jgi:hypothetical protein
MNKIEYYALVQAANTVELEKDMQQRLRQGFVPLGGPCVMINGSLVQAVVKYEETRKGEFGATVV